MPELRAGPYARAMARAFINPTFLGLFLIAACSGGTEVTSDTDGDTTGDTSGTTTSTSTIGTSTLPSTTASETSTTTDTTGEPTTSSTGEPTTSSTGEPTTGTTDTTGTTGDPGACDDGIVNGDETDIDCGGGTCEPCGEGLGCSLGEDCETGVCGEDNLCAAPACDDEALNGDETDVDCGGSCDPCGDGLGCLVEFDCISGVCGEDNLCALSACDDGLKNGLETDVDCGGGDCDGCPAGEACTIGGDCESGVCDENLCVAPTCDDGVQNGDEEDVDCGGPPCAPCILDGLILNEVDYDNVGSDNAEFVEIYNNTGDTVDLTGIALVLVNGSNDSVYNTIDLSGGGSLEQGKYLVVAPDGFVVPPETVVVNFGAASNNLQNGAPDGLALVDGLNLKILDALSYEGTIDGVNIPGFGNVSLVEGDALGTPDSNANEGSLSRLPNGNDTDNAATDWAFTSALTPGAANKP